MVRRPRPVWFLITPGAELLDLSGPWAVFNYANEVADRELYRLSAWSPLGGQTRTRHGLLLAATQRLRAPLRGHQPDVIVVAGGATGTPLPPAEARAVHWLRQYHDRARVVVSICTGAFVLGEAGLLDGRRVTTHWQFIEELRRRFPRAQVVGNDIFLRDGRVWTSAGITAGIDLSLALVEADHGHAIAMTVAKNLVLYLRRSGGQAQYSQVLQRQEHEPAQLGGLTAFIREHVDQSLPLDQLARTVGMSPRTFARWCQRELGETPAALVRRLRIEEAQRLLEQTTLPLKQIATRAHLGDPSTLWRVFTRHLGVTPADYRARFGAEPVPVREPRRVTPGNQSVATAGRQSHVRH